MGDLPLLYEKRNGIARITFNRPEARNAFTPEMLCRLADAWNDFRRDDAMRVAIVTGAGDRAFTAGFDLIRTIPLLSGARPPEDEWDHRYLNESEVMRDLIGLRGRTILKPIIAAINGAAIGGGTEMMQGMDLRIASENAIFSVPEVALGFMPGGGSAVRLPRQIPYCKAMEILLLGTPITADEACQMGLINAVVPAAELVERAEAWAERIVSNAPLAARMIKDTVLRTSGLTLDEAYAVETDNFRITLQSDDAREGPRAFAERRKPRFTGT